MNKWRKKGSKRGKTSNGTTKGAYPCDECDKVFTQKSNLRRHANFHSGNFKFYCEICRKGFFRKEQYDSHTRSHAGLKYRCEYCGKGLSSPLQMKYHMSEHTGVYRFNCDDCGKGFNMLSLLEKHVQNPPKSSMVIFLGEKTDKI